MKGGDFMIIDLQKDYKKLMIEKIKKSDLKVPKNISDDRLIIHYISYLRKKSFAGPHRIIKSNEFSCPEGYEKGFYKLEKIIEHGGDITPYFNRIASDLSKYDDLFSDWGVLHFHLGDEFIKGEHLVKRGDPILFAYLHDDNVYFINIYKHGHWEDSGVIQTMYNNWPEMLEKYVFPKEIKIKQDISRSDLRKTRQSGTFTLITIKNEVGDDICLMPPGMGLNTARTSNSDVQIYDDAMKKLRAIQLHLISEEEQIIEDMKTKGVNIKQEISFELIDFDQMHFYLLDKHHDFTITLRHA